jgi:hypothetical protein
MSLPAITQTYAQTTHSRPTKAANGPDATSSLFNSVPSSGQPERAKPLTGMHVQSRVQTVLPNGAVLSVFRFDLGKGDSGNQASLPTAFERQNDQTMLRALKELAAYFGYSPTAADIKLEGTAAVDLQDQTE